MENPLFCNFWPQQDPHFGPKRLNVEFLEQHFNFQSIRKTETLVIPITVVKIRNFYAAGSFYEP